MSTPNADEGIVHYIVPYPSCIVHDVHHVLYTDTNTHTYTHTHIHTYIHIQTQTPTHTCSITLAGLTRVIVLVWLAPLVW